MKATWLGQAGVLIETDNLKIMIDPYFSNSCAKQNKNLERRVPVKKELFFTDIDVIIITHNHGDHFDSETLSVLLNKEKELLVLAPSGTWEQAKALGSQINNYVMFNSGTVWSMGDVEIKGVKAEHSDKNAIGVVISSGSQKWYFTGDTLYNENIFKELPDNIDTIFLPINGAGNNMNVSDAIKFAKRVNSRKAVPLHWGLFDNIDPETFITDNAVIPEFYKEISL